METVTKIIGVVVGILIIGIIISLIFAFPVMWLWNYAVVGTIAGVAPLTFWKALAMMVLCSFLFKPLGSGSSKS